MAIHKDVGKRENGTVSKAIETIEVESGTLTSNEDTIEGLSFRIEIADDGSIQILFDPLVYDSPDSRKEGMRVYEIFEGIDSRASRRVPRFELSARSKCGKDIHTEYGRLSGDSKYQFGSTMTLTIVAEADELIITSPANYEEFETVDACVEYLTRGQLGGVVQNVVELPTGTLSYHASTHFKKAKAGYGVLAIEKKAVPRDDLEGWIEECDEVAERALHLLSLAQGTWYNWTARIVYRQLERGSAQLVRCIRPRGCPMGGRIHVFHHLNLSPLLSLLKEHYTQDLIDRTGLDMAILLMMMHASYTEGRLWSQLIAMSHLLEVFKDKVLGKKKARNLRVMDKTRFRNAVRPRILRVLKEVAEEGVIDEGSVEYETFEGKIKELNQPTLYTLFLAFVDHYRVPLSDLDENDIRSLVVHCRNDLAHRGLPTSVEGNKDRLYLLEDLAEELLNRVVMAMLGYKGQYVSALHMLEHYHFSEEGVRPLNPTVRKTS